MLNYRSVTENCVLSQQIVRQGWELTTNNTSINVQIFLNFLALKGKYIMQCIHGKRNFLSQQGLSVERFTCLLQLNSWSRFGWQEYSCAWTSAGLCKTAAYICSAGSCPELCFPAVSLGLQGQILPLFSSSLFLFQF